MDGGQLVKPHRRHDFEMATRTSGTEPTVPVSNRTVRNSMPATSPKGNFAMYISPGSIQGLAVFEGVNVLASVGFLRAVETDKVLRDAHSGAGQPVSGLTILAGSKNVEHP